MDNLFVFLLLFDYFKVPTSLQSTVLSWGIYGAVLLRGIFIGLGAFALKEVRAVLLVFGGVLLFSSVKLLLEVMPPARRRHWRHCCRRCRRILPPAALPPLLPCYATDLN